MPEFHVRAIEGVPREMLEAMVGKPEARRVVSEGPKRGWLSRAWRSLTGAAERDRRIEQMALAQERARMADAQAERVEMRGAIEESPMKFAVHEGGRAVGFASARSEPNSFGAHLPPYFTVTGFHLAEGVSPEAGAHLLRRMAEEAHGVGAKYVGLPQRGMGLQEALDHERRRLKGGDESSHIGEVETRLHDGEPRTGLKVRAKRHRK